MNRYYILPKQGVGRQLINGSACQVFLLAGIPTAKIYTHLSSLNPPYKQLNSIGFQNKYKKTEKKFMDFAANSLFRVGCKAMSLMLAADNE